MEAEREAEKYFRASLAAAEFAYEAYSAMRIAAQHPLAAENGLFIETECFFIGLHRGVAEMPTRVTDNKLELLKPRVIFAVGPF